MLTSCTGGTIRIYPQVTILDFDFDIVLDFRKYKDRRKRSVSPAGCIKRANPDQTVHPRLATQITVGIVPSNSNCRALDTRLIAIEPIQQLGFESAALTPTQVHPEKNFSPILRFRSPSAGVNGQQSVFVIIRSGQFEL